jgi:uncharacterized membrane protein YfcA
VPELSEVIILVLTGLTAGWLGGLLGIGGAVVMIPILVMLGQPMHIAQAAALTVTVFVAAPSALRHHKSGKVNWSLTLRMVPACIVGISICVLVANHVEGRLLEALFGFFLIYVAWANIRKITRKAQVDSGDQIRISWPICTVIGAATGAGIGLLGIGGGLVTVPLVNKLCRTSLPVAIACSAALMLLTAFIGAIMKDGTLHTLTDPDGSLRGLTWWTAVSISLWLIPTAIIGAWIGAKMTHTLPLKTVRSVFIALVLVSAAKLLWSASHDTPTAYPTAASPAAPDSQ